MDKVERLAILLFEESLDHSEQDRVDWIKSQTDYDLSVRQRALELLAFDMESEPVIVTGHALEDSETEIPIPDRIGTYKITDLIGRGGMGAVFRGKRDIGDFEHDVAIKIIKPSALSERLVERFQRERQILANFSHSNIARLYDGGTTTDGAPYIIMEYIDGLSIGDWADENNLNLDERIELFLSACNAVSYAHQNLIIHRDITPNNVLVTKEGVVKLIDFGIAKPLSSDQIENANSSVDRNSLASLSFTPGFAAPERAQGDVANTLSDVYSLGKLLKALTQPKSSSDELKAIITKATQNAPAERYASVDALSVDITNYKTGYPLDAVNQTLAYQSRKFIARNFGVTLLSFLSLLGLIGALGVTTNLYKIAERNEIEANHRFDDVRSLANKMMFDIYDDMDFVPGALNAKINLASAAQIYLDDLSKAPNSSDDIKIEAASGYIRLAEILGSPRMSNAGELEQAKLNIQKAEDILAAFNGETTVDVNVLSALYKLENLRATQELYINAQVEGADYYLKRALTYAKRAASLAPNNLEVTTDILQTRMEMAINARWDNRRDQAVDDISFVIDTYEDLNRNHPDHPIIIEEMGKAYRSKTEFLSTKKTAKDAIPFGQKAIDIEIKRGSNNPDANISQLRAMSFSYWRLGLPYFLLEDHENAVINYEKAIEFTQYIVERDLGNHDAKRMMASLRGEIASSLVNLGRETEAELHMTASKDFFQALYDSDPELGSSQRSMMIIHVQLYLFYQGWEKEAERCEHYEKILYYRDIMDDAGKLSESDRKGVEDFVDRELPC